MKKLFLMAAFVTASMFAVSTSAQTASRDVAAAPATEAGQANPEIDGDGVWKVCPVYAPKCCDHIGSGCVNCVGWNDECP